jgi:hypothetical protein
MLKLNVIIVKEIKMKEIKIEGKYGPFKLIIKKENITYFLSDLCICASKPPTRIELYIDEVPHDITQMSRIEESHLTNPELFPFWTFGYGTQIINFACEHKMTNINETRFTLVLSGAELIETHAHYTTVFFVS